MTLGTLTFTMATRPTMQADSMSCTNSWMQAEMMLALEKAKGEGGRGGGGGYNGTGKCQQSTV